MARQSDLRIDKAHIEKALKKIKCDREVPINRRSTQFCLIDKDGLHYPPKYVLSQAHRQKTGKERKHFKGGPQTNTLLKHEGCTVVPCNQLPDCQEWLLEQFKTPKDG